MRRTICVLALLTMIGCATLDDEIQPFIGKKRIDIVSAWGPPHHQEPGDNGSTVMYWMRVNGHRQERIWIYVNANGYIYYYRWQTRG